MTKQKAGYVDGFVLVVSKKNKAKYKKMASEGMQVWKKFGALDYKECILENAKPDKSITFTFPKMAGAKQGEMVWFSFITYKSRKHRDDVNKKVMAYFNEKYKDKKDMEMPFDMKRMASGGFQVEVGA